MTLPLTVIRAAHAQARAEMLHCEQQRNAAGLRDKAHWNYWQGRYESAVALFERIVKLRWQADRAYRWRERLEAYRYERGLGKTRRECLRGLARLWWGGVPQHGWLG